MKKLLSLGIAFILFAVTSSAVLVDMEDYIVSTGSYNNVDVYSDTVSVHRSDGGFYGGMLILHSGVTIVLTEEGDQLNASDYPVDEGWKPVRKPYRGYLQTNSTSGEVFYQGRALNNLTLTVRSTNPQEALKLLPEISISTKQKYMEVVTNELSRTLN